MRAETPRKPTEYLGDLKGKWKMKVGDYRLLYAYCRDCKVKHYEEFNQCFNCKSKNNNSVVYFDVIYRGAGYDDL